MPSVSDKQRKFMAAAAHDPAFAKKAGIDQSVAVEFNQADARQHSITTPGGVVQRGGYLSRKHG